MTHDEQIAAICEVAEAVGGKVRKDYSGRSMYGQTCYGISCEDAGACLEESGAKGLRGGRTDTMGLRFIVYWPSIKGVEDKEEG